MYWKINIPILSLALFLALTFLLMQHCKPYNPGTAPMSTVHSSEQESRIAVFGECYDNEIELFAKFEPDVSKPEQDRQATDKCVGACTGNQSGQGGSASQLVDECKSAANTYKLSIQFGQCYEYQIEKFQEYEAGVSESEQDRQSTDKCIQECTANTTSQGNRASEIVAACRNAADGYKNGYKKIVVTPLDREVRSCIEDTLEEYGKNSPSTSKDLVQSETQSICEKSCLDFAVQNLPGSIDQKLAACQTKVAAELERQLELDTSTVTGGTSTSASASASTSTSGGDQGDSSGDSSGEDSGTDTSDTSGSTSGGTGSNTGTDSSGSETTTAGDTSGDNGGDNGGGTGSDLPCGRGVSASGTYHYGIASNFRQTPSPSGTLIAQGMLGTKTVKGCEANSSSTSYPVWLCLEHDGQTGWAVAGKGYETCAQLISGETTVSD